MKSRRMLGWLLGGWLEVSGVGRGATIAATTPDSGPGQRIIGFGVSAGAAAFTISDTYQNVAISAWLSSNSGFGSFTGPLETYLTTYVGIGATTAEQVAAGTTNVTVNETASVEVPIFSGLTLGPGTYYLLLHGRNDPFYWSECNGCSPTLAPGVALPGDLLSSGFSPPTYAPAATFLPVVWTWAFAVNGDLVDPVPEPGTAVYAIPGFVLIWLLRRRLED